MDSQKDPYNAIFYTKSWRAICIFDTNIHNGSAKSGPKLLVDAVRLKLGVR